MDEQSPSSLPIQKLAIGDPDRAASGSESRNLGHTIMPATTTENRKPSSSPVHTSTNENPNSPADQSINPPTTSLTDISLVNEEPAAIFGESADNCTSPGIDLHLPPPTPSSVSIASNGMALTRTEIAELVGKSYSFSALTSGCFI